MTKGKYDVYLMDKVVTIEADRFQVSVRPGGQTLLRFYNVGEGNVAVFTNWEYFSKAGALTNHR